MLYFLGYTKRLHACPPVSIVMISGSVAYIYFTTQTILLTGSTRLLTKLGTTL